MTKLDPYQTNGSSPPEMIAGYRIHPAANLFPLMTEPELQALADDIKKNGQHDPIIYLYTGKLDKRGNEAKRVNPRLPNPDAALILDGRNRLLACEMAGKEPWLHPVGGDFVDSEITKDPIAFVLSKNLHRRHLTASQRAMIALEVEKLYAEQAEQGKRTDLEEPRDTNVPKSDGRAAVKAAKALDVSPTYVKKAKALTEADPKLAADVKAGKVSLSAATAKPQPKPWKRAGREDTPTERAKFLLGDAEDLSDYLSPDIFSKDVVQALAGNDDFYRALRLCTKIGERAKKILAALDTPEAAS